VVNRRPGAYEDFYRGVAAALSGAAPPPFNAWDAIATLEVIEEAGRSAAQKEVVELDEKV
jgi:predicted dehydrogenase